MEGFVVWCGSPHEVEEMLNYLRENGCKDSFGDDLQLRSRHLAYKEDVGFRVSRKSTGWVFFGYNSIGLYTGEEIEIISYYDFYNSYINTDAGGFEKSNYSVEYLLE